MVITDAFSKYVELIAIPDKHFVPREDGLLNSSLPHENGYECNGLDLGQQPPSPTLLPTYHVICTAKSDTWPSRESGRVMLSGRGMVVGCVILKKPLDYEMQRVKELKAVAERVWTIKNITIRKKIHHGGHRCVH